MFHPILRGMAAFILSLAAGSSALAADPFPNKPIRIVVPFPPGGSTDVKAGADGQIGSQFVMSEPADGHTILATADAFVLPPALKLKPAYDPVKDFIAIGPMVQAPYVVVAGMEQPFRQAKELVERAKSGKLEFASSASSVRLATESFLKSAGVQMLHVPYRGAAAALPDVVAGRVAVMLDAFPSSASFIQGGKVRALGVTSATRMSVLPDVPTLQEQGIPFTSQYWLGMFVRSGTPSAVVARISDALRHALSDPEYVERIRSQGGDPAYVTPQAFGQLVEKQTQDALKTAAELNIPKE